MASIPAVELFTTSILSNHKVRHRHERYIAVFTAKKIEYVYHDLASDEDAKKRFRRKALDPQIPNVLVHNEWRGTFEEFEEAVEFGELDLFLRIEPSRSARGVSEPPATGLSDDLLTTEPSYKDPATSGAFSSSSKLPPAPTAAPKMAPQGSGAGPGGDSVDEFLDSLAGLKSEMDSMSEAEISAILEEAESSKAREAHEKAPKAPKDSRRYPGEAPAAASAQIKRTYFPTEQAGTRPLRLPKMGNGSRTVSTPATIPSSGAASSSSSSEISSPRRSPAQHARFSVSQNSSRALAAEASASSSTRVFSARQVRSGLDSGKKLQEVLGGIDETSRSNRGTALSNEADALLEELGLSDLKLTDEEAEAFLLSGDVPDGLELGGSRLQRGGTIARKAREQEAAHDVAQRARSLATERKENATVAKERIDAGANMGTAEKRMSEPVPADMSSRTKEILERAKHKRASRQMALSQPVPSTESETKPLNSPFAPEAASSAGEVAADTGVPKSGEGRSDTQRSPAASDEQVQDSGAATDDKPEKGATDSSSEEIPTGEHTNVAHQEGQHKELAEEQASEGIAASPAIESDDANPKKETSSTTSEAKPPQQTSQDSADISTPTNNTPTMTSDKTLPSVSKSSVDLESESAVNGSAANAPKEQSLSGAETPAEEEEIDELLARLSGLGEHRLSTIVKPLPESPEQGRKEVLGAVAEGAEEVESRDAASTEEQAAAPAPTESAEPTLLKSPKLDAEAGAMQRSASSASASSSSSTTHARPARKSTSPMPIPGGSRKGMDIRRKASGPNLSLSPTSLGGAGERTVAAGRQSMPAPEGYYGPASPTSPLGVTSPRSPRLKMRLQRSFGSLGRKSTGSSSGGGGGMPSSPPLLPPAAMTTGRGSSSSKEENHAEWRSHRTLSQILRDADEAMADEDEEGDDDGEESLAPDDGLGELEIRI